MLKILREYVDEETQITEYTRDGITISHTVKQPISLDVPLDEELPNPPSLNQRIKEVENVIFDAMMEGKL